MLAAGLVARVVPALVPIYWYDEAFTVAMAVMEPGQILRATMLDVHPPLYYWLVWALRRSGEAVGGPLESLAWLRMGSVAAGMAVVVLCWWSARRWWGAKAGIVALALAAASPVLTFYSVELRNYAVTMALVLGATLALVEMLAARERWRWGMTALYAAAMAAALYTHVLAWLYLAGQGCLVLAELGRRPRWPWRVAAQAAAAWAVVLAAIAPWIPVMTKQERAKDYFLGWVGWAEWADWVLAMGTWLPWGSTRGTPGGEAAWHWWAAAATLAALGWLAVAAWRRRGAEPDRLLRVSAMMIMIPLTVAFFLSWLKIAPLFLGVRYNLVAAPFFLLMVAGLLQRLGRGGWRRRQGWCC